MSRLITIILVASIFISILLRLVLGRERSLKIEQLGAKVVALILLIILVMFLISIEEISKFFSFL